MTGIIKTIPEVREHIKINNEFSLAGLPNFNTAISTHLIPILGEELYTEIETAYAGTPTAAQSTLLYKCRAVIIPFAFAMELPTRHVKMGDTGALVMETEHTRKPYRWEYKELEKSLFFQGYAAQEMLLVYLKANAEEFPLWSESPYHSTEFAIIRDGSELREVSGLLQPHRCFMLLRGLFNTIADTDLIPRLSAAYYEALTARILAGTTTEEENEILPKLRKASARMVMILAASEMNMQFGANGFTIVDQTEDDPDGKQTAASSGRLMSFIAQQKESVRQLMEQVIATMDEKASATVFAEYFTSNKYTAPGSSNMFDQTRDGMFILS